ncbi:MAG: helix-turn-helix domain-containing protein [Ardenticatenaceae bacterium]|nr:helix-turn-helix domain-containing protein [Ardenticatenaceae bacterium]
MSPNLVNIIFGMKVRQARTENGLTLSEFASQCDLSPSYVTEIEKGRKYPRADKIMKIAETLGKEYDDLVSIKLGPSLSYLESTLSSTMLQKFPFGEFGLETGDLVNLLTREPERASALLHAILEMIRRYDVKEEDFLRAALRSYQEIHENYFQDLEDAALAFTADFGKAYNFGTERLVTQEALEQILTEVYGYQLDYKTIEEDERLSSFRSVFVPGRPPRLLVNGRLYPRQIKFLLARELGYQYLQLKERSQTSTPDEVKSFRQLLNDFRGAYFGGALMIPRAAILADLEAFFALETWNPQPLMDMLSGYDVTPEMLFYRFSELIPQHFGIPVHFLRYHQVGNEYKLIKHLNMNQLNLPSGLGLHEHYCRRWLSLRLLREMAERQSVGSTDRFPPPDVHISRFLNSEDRYVAFGFARSLVLSPGVNSSVTVGFRLTPDLDRTVHFVTDPAIPHVIINETCERCPLAPEECLVRAAPPLTLDAEQENAARKSALNRVVAQMRA